MTTITKTYRAVFAAAANTAGATSRGTLDLRTTMGGFLTLMIQNGATGPTTQCVASVLISHSAGATPVAASRSIGGGSTWKTIMSVGNGIAANVTGEWSLEIPPVVQHLEVEFTGNTGQSVNVEALFTEFTNIA